MAVRNAPVQTGPTESRYLVHRSEPNEVVEMVRCPICDKPREEWDHATVPGHLAREDHTFERLVDGQDDVDQAPRSGQTRLSKYQDVRNFK
jgi:hypothetical protein